MKESENGLDPQLWHACAGSMVQIPPLNSKVFYFPQGHAEHSQTTVDYSSSPRIPALIFCLVAGVKYLADLETDEVYAKISLVPLQSNELDFGDEMIASESISNIEKPASFAKTLTQSDANNGGGFSVPRYCAETIFPRLDYSANPPVQTVVAKDVHGETWKFRHIYRGTPRRHLLTTGWSTFVNQKKLVAGDSIVFLRAESGDLRIGIRRAKRGIGIGDGPESEPSGRNLNANSLNPYSGFSFFMKEDESKVTRNGALRAKGRVRPKDVLEAAICATNGQPIEVVYYPRAGTPEFFVKASSVRAAMRIQWCSGMRFKMAFETEDSSRISWFMGTVASAHVADPIRWPNSPWRLLQVTWDEPDILQSAKRVNPWQVELVSNMPVIHMSPFSPRKKLRLLQHSEFPLDSLCQLPSFPGNLLGPNSPMCCVPENIPAGIQGARHAQFGRSLSDLQFNSKLQTGQFLSISQQFNSPPRISETIRRSQMDGNENLSCLLTMESFNVKSEKCDNKKKHQFLLFGQPILTEQQITRSYSTDSVSEVLNGPDKSKVADVLGFAPEKQSSLKKSSSNGFSWHQNALDVEIKIDPGHCKVFMESEDVGRTLDLSVVSSYEELYRKLANIFGVERPEILSHVLYRDVTGAIRKTGDEPFSVFMKTAKRLTILLNPASNDKVGRTWITGMRNSENGLQASNKTGPLAYPLDVM
ncbi:hypothetical protein K2173_016779 [Erythroxylum novogranatense]|uniref:Auxin response factor n=1 Tax=Erythroxylum novogranatense TaxID=1862640 RepID=A0AAV8SHR0_9ROSI|nr:hypothetical protein K2173_016779 [Erythroxylum novogranatense]